jgi:hypothetical protein
VDVHKLALLDSPRAVSLGVGVVVLLDGDLVAVDGRDPGNVARAAAALVGLSNRSRLGRVVDLDTRLLGRVVPRVGVAPVEALVLVVELDAEALVDAPGDEGGAFWGVLVGVCVSELGDGGEGTRRSRPIVSSSDTDAVWHEGGTYGT